MRFVRSRPGVFALLSLLTLLPGGCASCDAPQRSGTYGEESANEAMQEYEREEEMRDSNL
jgi:hypothetical protein